MVFCESIKEKSRKVFLTSTTLPFSGKDSNHIGKLPTRRLQIKRASLSNLTCLIEQLNVLSWETSHVSLIFIYTKEGEQRLPFSSSV